MTTTYIFLAGYTKGGNAAAPSSAPTIKVVDSNNNIVVPALTAVTALSNLPGAHIYFYTGADGLNLLATFHTTDASVDQNQDLFGFPVTCIPTYWVGALQQGVASLQTAILGTTISVYNAVDIDFTLTGLNDFTGWTKIWFSAKNAATDTDAQAILQLQVSNPADGVNDGLLTLQGATQTKANGSITALSTTSIRVQVAAAAALNLIPTINAALYDIKALIAGKVTPISEGGSFKVTGVITKAVA